MRGRTRESKEHYPDMQVMTCIQKRSTTESSATRCARRNRDGHRAGFPDPAISKPRVFLPGPEWLRVNPAISDPGPGIFLRM